MNIVVRQKTKQLLTLIIYTGSFPRLPELSHDPLAPVASLICPKTPEYHVDLAGPAHLQPGASSPTPAPSEGKDKSGPPCGVPTLIASKFSLPDVRPSHDAGPAHLQPCASMGGNQTVSLQKSVAQGGSIGGYGGADYTGSITKGSHIIDLTADSDDEGDVPGSTTQTIGRAMIDLTQIGLTSIAGMISPPYPETMFYMILHFGK